MKKIIICVFLIFISSYIFANGDLFTIGNKIIGVKYDENSSDLWLYSKDVQSKTQKVIDYYKIESTGPDCRVISIFTDLVNDKNIIFLDVYLGNPGGRQSLDLQVLYIFEISKNGKFKLLDEKELVNLHYSVSAQKLTSNLRNFYFYNSQTKQLNIYKTNSYENIEIEKIDIKQLMKK